MACCTDRRCDRAETIVSIASGNTTEARKLLAQVLNIAVEDLEHDAAIGVTERWDSLAHMHLIMALEAHLGRPLDTTTMLGIESLSDIAALMA